MSKGQGTDTSPAHGHGGENVQTAGTERAHAESPAGHGGARRRFDLRSFIWPGGKFSLENCSYAILFASTALIAAGIGLGSWVKYTVYLAAGGSLLLLVGIVLYIISQLIAPESGTGEVKA